MMAALLVLILADVNSTAGLGPIGALGVGLAMIFMLTMLPAALAIFGRRAFWPFIPYGPSGPGPHGAIAGRLARYSHQTDETHGFWRRTGERVARRPRMVASTTVVILLVLCARPVPARHRPDQRQLVPRRGRGGQGQRPARGALPGRRERAEHGDRPARRRRPGGHGRAEAGPGGRGRRPAAGGPARHPAVDAAEGRPVLDRGVRRDTRTCATSRSRRAERTC